MLHALEPTIPIIVDCDVQFGEDAKKCKPEDTHDTIVDEAWEMEDGELR